jgi:hypothetical protein
MLLHLSPGNMHLAWGADLVVVYEMGRIDACTGAAGCQPVRHWVCSNSFRGMQAPAAGLQAPVWRCKRISLHTLDGTQWRQPQLLAEAAQRAPQPQVDVVLDRPV